METDLDRKRDDCMVVVGPEETAAARAAWPDVPIVALVDASEPTHAVFARSAGADVVVPATDLAGGWRSDTPGLDVAISAAWSLAERRLGMRRSSQRSAHDLGQALSAINLAAELAIGEDSKNERLLDQIRTQAQAAGTHAWRAGRAGRSAELALRPVDLSALLHRIAIAEPDIAVYDSSESAWVLGDVPHIERLLEELIQHGRHSATNQRIDVTVRAGGRVEITIRGTGTPRLSLPEGEVEFGLGAVNEIVNDLGGKLHIQERESGAVGDHLSVRLSLPLLPHDGRRAGLETVPPDNMAIQTQILEGVLRHAPLPESLEAIVVAIEQQLPGTKCSVLLLNDHRCLHHGAGASLPKAYRNEIDGVAIGYGQGSCGTAAFLGQAIVAADVETDRHWVKFKDVALEHNLRSCWSTPILAADGGAVLGTFAVYRSDVWEPDEAANRLVSRFTYLAAVAIGHHRLFKAVAESESRFRGAFEGATTGMALVGPDGSFLKVNPALCTMLGTNAVDLCDGNVLDLVEPAHREQIRDGWSELLDVESNVERLHQEPIEVPIVDHPGDEPLWVSLRSSLVSADVGGQQYFYIEIRDVSASRRHALERQARQAAELASQAKTDFLALVSHELRTPLNAVLGFAQVMQLVDLDAAQRAASIDNILTAGQHLLDLINELLDLSLIEAGQLSTSIEDVDTDEVIDEALQILRPLAESRDIALCRQLSATLAAVYPNNSIRRDGPTHRDDPVVDSATEVAGVTSHRRPVLHADRQCVRQVLINLLGNAVKFTPPGGEVGIVVSNPDNQTVRIQVVDSGPGIPAEAIDDLFQPFHRLSPDVHPHAEGTGLGLSLAARLVEEMRGTIGVESTPGVGSCFWIDLPGNAGAGPAPDLPANRQTTMPEPVECHPATGVVLYVEDDPASVQVITAALALRPGVEVRTAASASEGLAAALAQRLDVILLDIGLPDGSGWELLRTFREHPETATTPVVVLTAGPDVVPADAPSPAGIMAKPLDVGACLKAIDGLLAPTSA